MNAARRARIGIAATAAGVALALVAAAGSQAAPPAKKTEKPAHAFVGPRQCGICHKQEAKGNQFGRWSESKHARAFGTLASPAARAIAESRGIGDPTRAPECLRCHTTGGSVAVESGVTCESCHGAGGDYSSLKVMKDRTLAIAAGLILPGEADCRRCHNPESPTFKGFDFPGALAAIAHPDPTRRRP